MNKTFIINGGAGRVLAAIPALEKFHRLNPDNDFKVLIYGWESLYWSHPLLQSRTFSISQKGAFEQFIKPYDLMVPEPYDRRSYYTQQKSIAEAFDEEINNTDDHSDLGKPNLYLQKQEIFAMKSILEEQKKKANRDRVVVFQPYGSGLQIINNRPFDTSFRSLDVDDYLRVARKLSEKALVVFFGEQNFIHPGDSFTFKPALTLSPDLRFWMACISEADYFVGCDSVGQHIARAFDKPGTVFMGSTFEKNVSYPDYFNFVRNGKTPVYAPIRVSGMDGEFADRANDGLMDFTQEQLAETSEYILRKLGRPTQSSPPGISSVKERTFSIVSDKTEDAPAIGPNGEVWKW